MHKYGWRKNRKGSIEGLPLQLLIMIVIAAVGLGILLAWMNSISKPNAISRVVCEPRFIKSSVTDLDQEGTFDDPSLTVTVYDNKDGKLCGVNVQVYGLGVTVAGITSGDEGDMRGKVTLDISGGALPVGSASGELVVKVSKTDYGYKEVTVTVSRSSA